MQDDATRKIVSIVKKMGIPVSVIACNTGISVGVLYPVFHGKRRLRADEFIKICHFLNVEPMNLYNDNSKMDKCLQKSDFF